MKKILLSWIVGFMFLLACGINTQAEEIVIKVSTPEELDAVRENLSGHYQLANDIDMTGCYDIEPIGNETTGAFTGTFDGNGYTIKNLELNYSSYKYVGLFGYLNGTVQNVTLENVEIVGSRYVGGIAGYADVDSLITDCEVSGSIEGGSDYFYSYVAGISGSCYGMIKDCRNHAKITTTSKKARTAGISFGEAILIENCHNTGDITADSYVCGVGKSTTLKECSNNGNLTSTYYNTYGIGIADYIENCQNNGNLTGIFHVSGIGLGRKHIIDSSNSGEINSSKIYNEVCYSYGIGYGGTIENCINKGRVFSNGYSTHPDYQGAVYGAAYGIGQGDNVVKNCINYGIVQSMGQSDIKCGIGSSNIENCINHGKVIGYNLKSDYYSKSFGVGISNIKDSINTGNLVGGYVYGVGESNIERCSNTGTLQGIEETYTIGYSNIKNSTNFGAIMTERNLYYMGYNNISLSADYGYLEKDYTPYSVNFNRNNIENSYVLYEKLSERLFHGSNIGMSCLLNVSDGKKSFASIVESDVVKNLDYISTFLNDFEWNSNLPMLREIPIHLELNKNFLFLYKGETVQLKGRVAGEEVTDIVYNSENEAVANVSQSGLVTAYGENNGYTVITARTADGYQMNCHVFVYSRKPESVSITNKTSVLRLGQDKQLDAKIAYEMATEDCELTWTSSNPEVAAVSANGLVETKATGIVTISVTTGNGKTDSCTITVVADEMSLDASELIIKKGETAKVTPTLVPANAPDTITYSSSNTSIATVSTSGVISAKAAGTAVITVKTTGGLSQTCTVYVPGMTLSSTTASVNIGKTQHLRVTLTPQNIEQEITWTSANEEIATVDSDGVVTGVSQGTVTITGETQYGCKVSCVVTVTKLAIEISLDRTSITMEKGKTDSIGVTLNPVDATDTITYTSSNTNVVTVSGTGLLTAKNVGTSQITVRTSGGLSTTCSVVVEAASVPATEITLSKTTLKMLPEESIVLSATVLPDNATNKKITWSSSDEAVVTVNQGGTVTAKSAGTATIKAELSNGLYAICDVSVKAFTNTTIILKSASGGPGEKVSVPVEIRENSGIASMRLKVEYDSSMLTPVNVEAGNILAGAQLNASVDEDGIYYVLWSQASDMTENGTLFSIDFTVAESATSDSVTSIDVSYAEGDICDAQHNDVALKISSGEVLIQQGLPGDIFIDGKLNSHDILLLQQYMTELVSLSSQQMLRADLDGDGNITMMDVVALAQQLVNPSENIVMMAFRMSRTNEFVIELGEVESNQEGIAEVPVIFNGCPGISAFKFKINYNAEKMELISIEAATDVFAGNLMSNLENSSSGEGIVTWYSTENITPEGTVLMLRFVEKEEGITEKEEVTISFQNGDLCNDSCTSVTAEINNGAVLPTVHEHFYETVITEPTCDKGGYTTYTCNKCGDSYIDNEVEALGHSFTNYISDNNATTESAGTLTAKCDRCDATDTITDPAGPIVPDIPVEPVNDEVVRLSGAARYETGYKVADTLKERLGVEQFDAVVVATGKNFADALSGSYLAVVKNALILLTNGKEDNIATLHEYIRANVAENGTIYILGGEAAVPKTVEAINGFMVKRLAGSSRYDTNLAILAEAGMNGNELIVATGKSFADSLSASAVKLPILLVKPGAALSDEAKAIAENMSKIYIIGGEGAVSKEIEAELAVYGEVKRIAGKSRYETSIAVANTFYDNVKEVVVASGKNFPDGLCGGPLAASIDAPLILTADSKADIAADYVKREAVEAGYVLGGTGAIGNDSVAQVFGLKSVDEIISK